MNEPEMPLVIDIEKVFKEKNPKLYRWIPGFVMSYIKRILHQEEMNTVLKKGVGIKGIDFADLVLKELEVSFTHEGLENFPKNGSVILCSNHPLGGLDGVALISLLGSVRQDIRFIVNDLLTNFSNFGEVFVPVNKLGSNIKSNLENIEKIYASDMAVVLFPAGLCSRKINGKIQDLVWQKSFITKAQKYNHPIIPIHVNAKNSSWFYNLANFRKFLGIKANIEMFWLSDEMFKQKGKSIKFTFGKPIPASTFTKEYSQLEWSSFLRSFVYQLKKDKDLSFNDFVKNKNS